VLLSGCGTKPVEIIWKPPYCEHPPSKEWVASLHRFITKMPKYKKDVLVLDIPMQQLFNANSANISPNGIRILENVVGLANSYEIVDIKLVGYRCTGTGSSGEELSVTKSLAEESALRVVDYLWQRKVDMRLGTSNGIRYECKAGHGSQYGDFVEISFQVLADKCKD